MAEKRPLAVYGNEIAELAYGDTLPGVPLDYPDYPAEPPNPSSSLYLWLDPTFGLFTETTGASATTPAASGDGVGTWRARTGQNLTQAGTAKPIYRTGDMGSYLDFYNGYLTGAVGGAGWGTSEGTLLVRYGASASRSMTPLASAAANVGNGDFTRYLTDTDGRSYARNLRTSAGVIANQSTAPLGYGPHTAAWVSGSDYRVYLNGSLQAPATTTAWEAPAAWVVGTAENITSRMHVYAALAYNRALTDSERRQAELYLAGLSPAPGGILTTVNNYVNTTKADQTPVGATYGLLVGTVNGSNKVFTVSNAAYVAGTLVVTLNGQVQTQGASYDFVETSATAGTFTFATAPPTGSVVQAFYVTRSTSNGFATAPLATVTGINAKSTGTTTLYTVPGGKTAVITDVVVRCTAASAITVPASAGVGIAAGEDDIYASASMTGLTAANKAWRFPNGGVMAVGTAASVIKLGIDTAATGTSQTLACDVMGYLL